MTYRDPNCPASRQSVRAIIDSLNPGDEAVTDIPSDDLHLCCKFRAALTQISPGKYTTTTGKGDGYLWVKRL